MTRQAIIDQTVSVINQLPEDKAKEIAEFAEFISKKHEENELVKGIQQLASKNPAFDFLHNEEELYTIADLKEIYNG